MLQEVNITSAELQSMHLPEGWAAAAQLMLMGHMKGNMVLVGPGGVLGSKDYVVDVEDISNVAYDMKGVRVRISRSSRCTYTVLERRVGPYVAASVPS
eukprot:54117-Eustigmatos_ZCMA.PRE.1